MFGERVNSKELDNQKIGEKIQLSIYPIYQLTFISISAKIEAELNDLSDEEKIEYLKELGLEDSA